MNYNDKIKSIAQEILNAEEDVIIVGDNSSGKSDVLKEIINNLLPKECYYIDSCNRTFEYKNTLDINSPLPETTEVLKTRLEEGNYNLKDSFGRSGVIERIFSKYKDSVLEFISRFLNKNISLEDSDTKIIKEKIFKVNGEIYDYLSSGYQAIFRLFLEIIYAADKNKELKTIIIDEITEFLSAKNEAKILTFLKENFPQIKFIVTTHSEDIISNTPKTRLVVIQENNFEILDGDDFQDNTSVRRVFNNLFFSDENEKQNDEIESRLRNLLNKKLFDTWKLEDDSEIEKLEKLDLTNSEKLILKGIKEF